MTTPSNLTHKQLDALAKVLNDPAFENGKLNRLLFPELRIAVQMAKRWAEANQKEDAV
jgi:hypothetical protein